MPSTPTSKSGDDTPEKGASTASERTEYEKMVLEDVPWWRNLLSPFFTLILLAGFLVLPGSFSTLETIEIPPGNLRKVLHAIENLPLYVPPLPTHPPPSNQKKTTLRCFSDVWGSTNRLVIAYCFCALGGGGMCLLWWLQRHNCVWLLSHIFVPGMLSGLSGLVSSLVSVYATHQGI